VNLVLLVSAFALLGLAVPYVIRVANGPTVFDRIVGLNGLGTKAPVLLVLTGLLFERAPMFVDLALALFLLNLFVTLLVARYVRAKRSAEP
jgi:multicomponent Na+:H+ antiporter subunit F